MQVFLVACLVAVAAAGRLENTYLPPQGARGSGGSGSILASPFKAGGSPFGAPSPFGKAGGAPAPAPSGAYGAPGGGAGGHARSGEAAAQILRYDNDNDGLGSYSYQYETENRIQAQEAGQLKNAGSEGESISAHGSYSYTGPDGAVYTVTYIADENGFQPSGDHLPTSPPIPEAILKSLQLNAAEEAHAPAGGAASGQYQAHAGGAASGQYQAPAPSKNYGAPSHQSFSPQSGYKY